MTNQKEQTKPARYQVSTSLATEQNRSLPSLLTSRLDYVSQGGLDPNPSNNSDIKPILDLLANVSGSKEDYLLVTIKHHLREILVFCLVNYL